MEGFRKLFRLIITCILIYCVFLTISNKTYADSRVALIDQNKEIKRSLESLRDLDCQTWQLIAYPSSKESKNLILRIVGFPGSLRVDHPTNLIVNSGRKTLYLKDITKSSTTKVEKLNDSAAEFDMTTLIAELDRNRPLTLRLPGLINDLPIPPYLVSEWRSLVK